VTPGELRSPGQADPGDFIRDKAGAKLQPHSNKTVRDHRIAGLFGTYVPEFENDLLL
jgi:hypothetical protein